MGHASTTDFERVAGPFSAHIEALRRRCSSDIVDDRRLECIHRVVEAGGTLGIALLGC